MGLEDMPMDDWKIRSAAGKEYAFDSEEEARQALPEYGDGATLWKRRAYRGILHLTMSPGGWKEVTD
ncbi:hypothetical protein [Kitasatospora purpeofusca]|uniref:hypothetical protein n=1 Tax=Kitasatospora purpeofusca TaxID=67352 RepID=UPI002A5A6C64|nr:hypothetical protein [Kitasatospora purpeofusca]MDY0811081.1 hypothetical protein [Kitasatospora purpeofusca]